MNLKDDFVAAFGMKEAEAGVKMRQVEIREQSRLRRLQVRQWRRAGLTLRQIAEKLGRSIERARSLCWLGEKAKKKYKRWLYKVNGIEKGG